LDDDFSRFFRGKVGFVFQNPDIQLFCPTVKEDILFGPLQLGAEHEEAKNRMSVLADLLDIKGLLGRAPHQLSIGEKRKAALAAVLAIEPDVIILDEPTAGLDPLTTRHIIDMLLEFNGRGKTIITATHDMQIVGEISDTVYVFDKNKTIIRHGNPSKYYPMKNFLNRTILSIFTRTNIKTRCIYIPISIWTIIRNKQAGCQSQPSIPSGLFVLKIV